MENLLARRPFLYCVGNDIYMLGNSKFKKCNDQYDSITATRFWNTVNEIGANKIIPRWILNEQESGTLGQLFQIALGYAGGVDQDSHITYREDVAILNGLSNSEKEKLCKDVEIFVACWRNFSD